jgi:hypothetical protein
MPEESEVLVVGRATSDGARPHDAVQAILSPATRY